MIEKGGVDCSMLSPEKIKEFEETAEKFVHNDMLLEAIKVYSMTSNKSKLIGLGNTCLKMNKVEFAFEAFKNAKDRQGLVDVGGAFLGEGRLRNAYIAFKLSEDEEMIKFFETNWKEGMDYYV